MRPLCTTNPISGFRFLGSQTENDPNAALLAWNRTEHLKGNKMRYRSTLIHFHNNCDHVGDLKRGAGVQGRRSSESTRLPPKWPGFHSQIRRHMWVEFVGSLLCTERFSPGTPVSPLLKNQPLT